MYKLLIAIYVFASAYFYQMQCNAQVEATRQSDVVVNCMVSHFKGKIGVSYQQALEDTLVYKQQIDAQGCSSSMHPLKKLQMGVDEFFFYTTDENTQKWHVAPITAIDNPVRGDLYYDINENQIRVFNLKAADYVGNLDLSKPFPFQITANDISPNGQFLLKRVRGEADSLYTYNLKNNTYEGFKPLAFGIADLSQSFWLNDDDILINGIYETQDKQQFPNNWHIWNMKSGYLYKIDMPFEEICNLGDCSNFLAKDGYIYFKWWEVIGHEQRIYAVKFPNGEVEQLLSTNSSSHISILRIE